MWMYTGEGNKTSVIQGFHGRTIASMQTLLLTKKDQSFMTEGPDVGYQVGRTPGKV